MTARPVISLLEGERKGTVSQMDAALIAGGYGLYRQAGRVVRIEVSRNQFTDTVSRDVVELDESALALACEAAACFRRPHPTNPIWIRCGVPRWLVRSLKRWVAEGRSCLPHLPEADILFTTTLEEVVREAGRRRLDPHGFIQPGRLGSAWVERDVEAVDLCRAFIRQAGPKVIPRRRWSLSSYGLKHVVESENKPHYVPNGCLIVAAYLEGLDVKPIGSSAVFRCAEGVITGETTAPVSALREVRP